MGGGLLEADVRARLNSAYSRARKRQAPATVAIEDYLPRFRSDGHLESVDLRDWSVAVEDEAAARELASRAGEFIAELPPAYRDVIWMYDVEEMPAAEIAETLEISIPAFKSRLHRARLFVRQRLAEIAGSAAREKVAG